jgi:hypothetical protein
MRQGGLALQQLLLLQLLLLLLLLLAKRAAAAGTCVQLHSMQHGDHEAHREQR